VFFSRSSTNFLYYFLFLIVHRSELRYVRKYHTMFPYPSVCSWVQISSPLPFFFKEASFTALRRPTSLCYAYAIWITYFFPSVLYTFISLAFFCGIYFLRTAPVERRLLMFALSHGFQYLQNMNSQWLATIQQIWLHQIEEERILRFGGFKMESRIIKF